MIGFILFVLEMHGFYVGMNNKYRNDVMRLFHRSGINLLCMWCCRVSTHTLSISRMSSLKNLKFFPIWWQIYAKLHWNTLKCSFYYHDSFLNFCLTYRYVKLEKIGRVREILRVCVCVYVYARLHTVQIYKCVSQKQYSRDYWNVCYALLVRLTFASCTCYKLILCLLKH